MNNPNWVTANRRSIPVSAMTTDHILNCIQAIQQGRVARAVCNGFLNAEWILIFRAELARRNR